VYCWRDAARFIWAINRPKFPAVCHGWRHDSVHGVLTRDSVNADSRARILNTVVLLRSSAKTSGWWLPPSNRCQHPSRWSSGSNHSFSCGGSRSCNQRTFTCLAKTGLNATTKTTSTCYRAHLAHFQRGHIRLSFQFIVMVLHVLAPPVLPIRHKIQGREWPNHQAIFNPQEHHSTSDITQRLGYHQLILH
jgi:hypothetical protein